MPVTGRCEVCGVEHPAAPVRPYTRTSDMLIVQFMNEDGFSVAELARQLNRDPEDLREHMGQAIKQGTFRRIHKAMMEFGGVYATKMRKRAKKEGWAEMGTG